MTTVLFVKKKCFVCGAIGKYPEGGVRNLETPEDLDGRPGGIHRPSIYMLMQRCLSCKYCSPNIETGPPEASKMINEAVYIKQLEDKNYPSTANAYLCWAMIMKKVGLFNDAGKAVLHAAWVCDDDSEFREKAKECRKEVISLFQKAQSLKQPFASSNIEEKLFLIDIMRRSGLFEQAGEICSSELKLNPPENAQSIFMFQEELIEQKDAHRHTIQEAMDQG